MPAFCKGERYSRSASGYLIGICPAGLYQGHQAWCRLAVYLDVLSQLFQSMFVGPAPDGGLGGNNTNFSVYRFAKGFFYPGLN